MKTVSKLIILSIVFLSFISGVNTSYSCNGHLDNKKDEDSISINADNIEYIKEKNTIIATGNVELISGKYILNADRILYFKNNDSAEAHGNVSLVNEEGDVAFADQLILTDKMTRGLVKALSIRFSNDVFLNAESAVKLDENKTILYNAAYSACKIENDYPLWQITSDKTVIDRENDKISYNNAKLKIYGKPILFTPYFSHHTSRAKRKSGFLVPKHGKSDDMGFSIEIPYYYNIAPNMDLVSTVKLFTSQNPLWSNNFRAITPSSKYNIQTSVTNPKEGNIHSKRKVKGHISFDSTHELSNDWVMRTNYNRTNDKTYLKRYDINMDTYLSSNADFEKITDKEHFLIKNMVFQDLRSTYNDMPKIYPYIDYTKTFAPGKFNERFFLNMGVLNLKRKEKPEMERITTTFGFRIPKIFQNGNYFEFLNYVRLDGYNVRRVPDGLDKISGTAGRIFPVMKLYWENPQTNGNTIIIPKAMIAYSSYNNNPKKIYNEDSSNLELNDNNLFSENRYSGIDLVETGLRGAYGVEFNTRYKDYEFSGMIGQALRSKKDERMPKVSGLSGTRSDYVGYFNFMPNNNMEIFYRFRLDQKNLGWHNNQMGLKLKILDMHKLQLSYYGNDQKDDPVFKKQKYADITMNGAINKNLSLDLNVKKILTSKKITSENGMMEAGIRLNYNHDCINLSFGATRNYIRDRDVVPDTVYMLKINLKTLN